MIEMPTTIQGTNMSRDAETVSQAIGAVIAGGPVPMNPNDVVQKVLERCGKQTRESEVRRALLALIDERKLVADSQFRLETRPSR